jgi:hypothetical protein
MSRTFIFVGSERYLSIYNGEFEGYSRFLDLEASAEDLGQAVVDAILASHNQANPFPLAGKKAVKSEKIARLRRYDSWCESVVERFGFKDRADLFRPMLYVTISFNGERASFLPSRQIALDGWDADPYSQQHETQLADLEDIAMIGQHTRDALTKCGTRYSRT